MRSAARRRTIVHQSGAEISARAIVTTSAARPHPRAARRPWPRGEEGRARTTATQPAQESRSASSRGRAARPPVDPDSFAMRRRARRTRQRREQPTPSRPITPPLRSRARRGPGSRSRPPARSIGLLTVVGSPPADPPLGVGLPLVGGWSCSSHRAVESTSRALLGHDDLPNWTSHEIELGGIRRGSPWSTSGSMPSLSRRRRSGHRPWP
jgi:hypothetical protein